MTEKCKESVQLDGMPTDNDIQCGSFIAKPGIGSATGGVGGDVSFIQGPLRRDGSLNFTLADGTVCLQFDCDGKVFVRGQQVDDNTEIYAAFRHWLRLAIKGA